jgi:hypothetical protein
VKILQCALLRYNRFKQIDNDFLSLMKKSAASKGSSGLVADPGSQEAHDKEKKKKTVDKNVIGTCKAIDAGRIGSEVGIVIIIEEFSQRICT